MTDLDGLSKEFDGCIDYKDADTLERLYWGERLNLSEIAELCDCSTTTVGDWMERHGIDRRRSGPSDDPKPDSVIDHTDPETLRELYHGEGLSQPEIADRAGVTHQTIDHHMKKHGIERRDRVKASRWGSRREYAHRYMAGGGYINYVDTWGGDGSTIALHRLLAISEYGFDEVSEKVVHHKNKIPWDNRPDNIELMTESEHVKHHMEQGDL